MGRLDRRARRALYRPSAAAGMARRPAVASRPAPAAAVAIRHDRLRPPAHLSGSAGQLHRGYWGINAYAMSCEQYYQMYGGAEVPTESAMVTLMNCPYAELVIIVNFPPSFT